MHGLQLGAGLAAGTGVVGAGIAAAPAIGSAVGAAVLPSAAHAGELFDELENTIGDNSVDVTKAGDIAQEAKDWAQAGGQMPKVIRNFISRMNDTELGDVTFSEARNFLQNSLARLSTQESMKLTGPARHYIGQFADALDSGIRDTAADAGVLDDYSNAVDEYRQAMNLGRAWETTKELGKAAVKTLPWIGGAYAIAKKYLP